MTTIANAVLALDSTAQISTVSDNLNEIIWHDGNPNGITLEQITAKQEELAIQAESDATAKQNRLDSVKTKLEALGLTTEEVKDAFGL